LSGDRGQHTVAGWLDDDLLTVSNEHGAWDVWRQRFASGAPVGSARPLGVDVREDVLGVTRTAELFYRFGMRDQRIVVDDVDLRTGVTRPDAVAPFTDGAYSRPQWLPTGGASALLWMTPTMPMLVIRPATGRPERRLTLPLGAIWTYSWSPDGRSLLMRARDLHGRMGIFKVDAATNAIEGVLLNTPSTKFSQPQWARDGRRFSYVRGPDPFNATPADELIQRDAHSGLERVMLRNSDLVASGRTRLALRDWVVAPDGRSAAALEVADDYHAVWIASLADHRARELYRVPKITRCCAVPITHNALAWTPDGSAILANVSVGSQPERRELQLVSATDEHTVVRIDTGAHSVRNDAPAVSPDGRHVAFLAGKETEFEIRLVDIGGR
jgi:Tol biopolymer transport system component